MGYICKTVFIALPLTLSLSGCAMWPKLDSDSTIDPRRAQVPVCLSLKAYYTDASGKLVPDRNHHGEYLAYDQYTLARGCAYQTMEELSTMLEATGTFDRTISYAALGIGTGVGAVLGFKGTTDTLKGLGILSGSLLGLNSIVKTDAQRTILSKALKDVSCLMRSADAIMSMDAPSTTMMVNNDFHITTTKDNQAAVEIKGVQFQEPMILMSATMLGIKSSAYNDAVSSYASTVKAKKTNIPSELASAVMAIRMDVRQQINSLSNSQTILSDQQDRVTKMIGDLVAKKNAKNAAMTQLLDARNFSYMLGTTSLVSSTPDPETQFDNKLSQVFNDCASEPAKSAIGNK